VLSVRLGAALRRARTYLLFRSRPKLRSRLQGDLQRLKAEALDIEMLLEDARIHASAS
jgi:hypothetical protein